MLRNNLQAHWAAYLICSFLALLICATFLPFAPLTTAKASDGEELPDTLPNGVAAGDATQDQVVLWTRTTMTNGVRFVLPGGGTIRQQSPDPDIPNQITISGLAPNTDYAYAVRNSNGDRVSGHFRSPAAIGDLTGLRFGVSGDWYGNLRPFPALNNAVDRNLDFFIALGDTVYADIRSPAVSDGTVSTLEEYRRKHEEPLIANQGENALVALRANTLFYAMIDDHEIINDFAGGALAATDARFPETNGYVNDTERYENGLQAFEEYYPMQVEEYGRVGGDGRMDGEHKLYRYRTFGSDAAIFLLDARTFRHAPIADPIGITDLDRFYDEVWSPGRTLLGEQQLADLKRDLLRAEMSGITWKFVVVPEPIQIVGPFGASDRFEGYAVERADLLGFIHEHQLTNVAFVAADIHGTLINNLTFRTEQDGPVIPLAAFEVTTGPVAQPAVIGPRIAGIAHGYGWLSAADLDYYMDLPVDPDRDDRLDDQDDVVKQLLNSGLAFLGEDSIGLEDSPVQATLLSGDYLVTHTYGWTEFDIDQESQELMVTTYGIPVYDAADLANDSTVVAELSPEILSQFRVAPMATYYRKNYLPMLMN